MEAKTIVGIDPGMATGISVGEYSDTEPYKLLFAVVVHNGVKGFIDWWRREMPYLDDSRIVFERFVLRNNGFVPDLEAVKIEGALMALAYRCNITYQLRTAKATVPDSALKEHGLWQTGKTVGHTDGRDVNDSIIHALHYMQTMPHEPTLREYFSEQI